jgi:hypothetical protein
MNRSFAKSCLIGVSWALLLISGATNAAGDHGHGVASGKAGPIEGYRELTPDETAIQAVLNTYAQAMEQKSVETMEQAIIPGDFSTIESGYPNWTWEDFRDNHLLIEMDTFTDVDYDIKLISGEFQGSLGFAVYQYTASGKIQEKSVSISGLGTAILEQTDDGWRIHHLHTSAPRSQLEGMGG